MKSSIILRILVALLSIPATIALPNPIPARAAESLGPTVVPRQPAQPEVLAFVSVETKRGIQCRTCPRDDCPPVGTPLHKGTPMTLRCFTTDKTTKVNGDPGWGQQTGSLAWFSLARLSWEGELTSC